MKKLERFTGETARDYAFRVLKDNIVSLELKPGTLVSENDISSRLGLSRTPVREAIIDLAKASVIEIFPQKGSYVALIDPKMVEEARFLRRALDCAVIEAACQMAGKEAIAQMEDNVLLQEFYLEKGNAAKIYDLDNEFHRLIYKAADKTTIFDMSSTMMIHFDRVRSLSVATVKDMKIVADHRDMLEAVKARDSISAKKLVDKHLSRYRVDESLIKKQYPDFFTSAPIFN